MKTACFIPIKANSERVKGKNFRLLNDRKLYEYIVEHAMQAAVFDDIFIDTNSDEIKQYASSLGVKVIDRIEALAANSANGNDLLLYHAQVQPNYDYYFQLFATAPFLSPTNITCCVTKLLESDKYDSCFTAIAHHGFFWFNDVPVNYRPGILPRSQDMRPVLEETTGLYGISRESLLKYNCRIGRNPYIHIIDKTEAVDINTEDDFLIAQSVALIKFKNKSDRQL